MSEIRELMMNSAGRLFAELAERKVWQTVEAGEWPASAWTALEEMGLPHALAPEEAGGSGLAPADGLALAELAGYHALPLPLVETLVGSQLLAVAGLLIPEGPLGLAAPRPEQPLQLRRSADGWSLSGELARVPWGRHVAAVVASAQVDGVAHLLVVPTAGLAWREDINLAGEPRDSAVLHDLSLPASAVAPARDDGPSLLEWGALARSLQMGGAMRRALEQSVQYANERIQFGRPIGKFQAIQQQLAAMAGQVAAAGAAADTAAQSIDTPHYGFGIAVAKARVGEAAGQAAAIAHQVHGAMGFTREHTLHLSTRRLWSWRDEFGGEPYWQRQIGLAAAARGADGLWPYLTAL
jgi:acyl-CoA dehydrogenase